MSRGATGVLLALLVLLCAGGQAQAFEWKAPGNLPSGSGVGWADRTVFAPGIRFPIETAPAFANSQLYNPGGQRGGGGSQCHALNYQYPWRDTFCESRSHKTPACPTGNGHQGQDIRPATCKKDAHWTVAAEESDVAHVGVYTVTLIGRTGTVYRYMHLNMGRLAVKEGDAVVTGQRIGLVSNHFGATPTTIHLHFEIQQNVSGKGMINVPPYMSLVRSYERLISNGTKEPQ